MKRIFMGMMIMLCMSMTNVHAFGTTIHGLNGQLSDEELKRDKQAYHPFVDDFETIDDAQGTQDELWYYENLRVHQVDGVQYINLLNEDWKNDDISPYHRGMEIIRYVGNERMIDFRKLSHHEVVRIIDGNVFKKMQKVIVPATVIYAGKNAFGKAKVIKDQHLHKDRDGCYRYYYQISPKKKIYAGNVTHLLLKNKGVKKVKSEAVDEMFVAYKMTIKKGQIVPLDIRMQTKDHKTYTISHRYLKIKKGYEKATKGQSMLVKGNKVRGLRKNDRLTLEISPNTMTPFEYLDIDITVR